MRFVIADPRAAAFGRPVVVTTMIWTRLTAGNFNHGRVWKCCASTLPWADGSSLAAPSLPWPSSSTTWISPGAHKRHSLRFTPKLHMLLTTTTFHWQFHACAPHAQSHGLLHPDWSVPGLALCPVRCVQAGRSIWALVEGSSLTPRCAAFQRLSYTLSAQVYASRYVAEVSSYGGTRTTHQSHFGLVRSAGSQRREGIQSRGKLCHFSITRRRLGGPLKIKASFALASARNPTCSFRVRLPL
jgi:hypothetical protein